MPASVPQLSLAGHRVPGATDLRLVNAPASLSTVIVGSSEVAHTLRRAVMRAAGCDAKVLITGETGAGKDLAAACVHALGARAAAPFVTIHCAAISDALLESELFGHTRGAFTGATRDRPGQLATAESGTVFLDDIGETSPRMQGMLLRFLETGEVQRIGDLYPRSALNVRVLAATSRYLEALVAAGRFRQDLYYRLNVIHIHVPPLRERLEDIPALVDHFAARFELSAGRVPWLLPASIEALQAYSWPGNVRELESLLKRIAVAARDGADVHGLLPKPQVAGDRPAGRRERRRTVADDLFEQLIEERGSFWTLVSPRLIQRDITRRDVRGVIQKGLEATCGSYKATARLFHVADAE
jgi:transcriptional regulator with PAS, ATPase and Fis domain